jgi:hypothetical protein
MITFNKILTLSIFMSLCCANSSFAKGSKDLQYEFFKNSKTFIKDPFNLRDPFKRKQIKRSSGGKTGSKRFKKDGIYTNLPTIDTVSLDKIRVVGVLLGSKRRAIAKITGGEGEESGTETYVLKEGMKLGEDGAEIKAILPGGIVVVEKIRNVYDQDEYLETIIPVSSE